MRSVWRNQQSVIAEMRRSMRLAIPLIAAQLVHIGNGMIDTLVSGRIGRTELAGVGIGSSLWFIVMLSSIGLMAGLSPTISKLVGQHRQNDVGRVYRQGLWMGLSLGLINLAVLIAVIKTIPDWGFESELTDNISAYLNAAKWGIVPAAILLAARNVCEAVSRPAAVFKVQIAGLTINLLADLGFGLGWFGLPILGLAGIGWSTTIVMWTTCALLLWMINGKGFRRYTLYRQFDLPDFQTLRSLFVLAVPICLSVMFEAGLFTATAIQVGKLGTLPASAHNVAIGATAFMYMLPLGLSFVLTARIGVALGRKSAHSIRLRAGTGVITTIMMATFSCLLLLLFREQIAALYTTDDAVRKLATELLMLAAIFQLSDALQCTLLAMLRGLHDTRVPMLINAFSYWAVGFGFGYYCAHNLDYGAHGFWMGLIVGLTLSALLLGWRLHHMTKNAESLIRFNLAATQNS